MKQKLKNIFLLLLFASTQCAAPLVHAHVGGVQAMDSVHIHNTLPPIAEHNGSECYVESDVSQAFSIPHEHQRDDTPVILGGTAPSTLPILPRLAVNIPVAAFARKPATGCKPQSHAPPHLS